MKYFIDHISVPLFTWQKNLSKHANLVGNKSFSQLLTSYQAQVSQNSPIAKNGLTASDYLANPIISKPLKISAQGLPSLKNSVVKNPEKNYPLNHTEPHIDPARNTSATILKTDRVNSDRNAGVTTRQNQTRLSEKEILENSISNAAAKYNLPPELIKAVIKAESNFDANAVSSAGAQGIMQLMPATAEELGVKNPFDVDQNIDGGSHYLRKMLDKFGGNIKLALAAYNAGPGTVEKYDGNVPYRETQNYVKRVIRFSAMFT